MKIKTFKYHFEFKLTPEEQKTAIAEMERADIEKDHLHGVPPEMHEATIKAFKDLLAWCKTIAPVLIFFCTVFAHAAPKPYNTIKIDAEVVRVYKFKNSEIKKALKFYIPTRKRYYA